MNSGYLAGRISGLSWNEASEWRDLMVRFCYTVNWYNPLDKIRALEGVERINTCETGTMSNEDIFKTDTLSILMSSFIVANLLPGVVFGTPFEIGYAWGNGISVILITREEHPFYSCADVVVPTVSDAIRYVNSVYG